MNNSTSDSSCSFQTTATTSQDLVTVTLLFFAHSRDLAGVSQASVSLSAKPQSRQELLNAIVTHFPPLEVLRGRLLLAINETYVDPSETVTLQTGAEVAVIPPLSGG